MKSTYALVAVGVVALVAAAAANAVVSPQLVGKWKRTVSRADVRRAEGASSLIGSVCTFTVKKSDSASVSCTNVGAFHGTIVSTGANRVHLNLGIPAANGYSWHVSGQSLTFREITDSVPDRVAVFAGTWKRSSP